MATVAVNTSSNVNIDFQLAGIDKRLLAWFIDLVIRIVYIIGCVWLFKSASGGVASMLYSLALILPMVCYYLLFELLLNGQTPGKMLFKIKVVSLEGYKPTFMQYLNRWIFRLMDAGFMTVVFFGLLTSWVYGLVFVVANIVSIVYTINNKKEQRIGDLVANTVVIRLTSTTKIDDTIFTNIESGSYKVTYPAVIKLSDRDVSIIKDALNYAVKQKRSDNLWNIAQKLKPVVNATDITDPYVFLDTLIKDYSYITTSGD